MKPHLLCAVTLAASATVLLAAPKIVVNHHDNENASADFVFKDVPPLSHQDAAAQAKLVIVDGRRDRNGGGLEKLQDGLGPSEGDEPAQNFFFAAGTDGGRLLMDLNREIEMAAVNAYSWHNGDRGPQVYHLYASRGNDTNFNAQPHRGINPVTKTERPRDCRIVS